VEKAQALVQENEVLKRKLEQKEIERQAVSQAAMDNVVSLTSAFQDSLLNMTRLNHSLNTDAVVSKRRKVAGLLALGGGPGA
jgi:hypothetical protein